MEQNKNTLLDAAFIDSLQAVFSPVVIQLLHALLSPNPSFFAIGELLRSDPMLTATVLQIANSSAYGFKEKITDIERAAIAIGTAELSKLVISILFQKNIRPQGVRSSSSLFGDWRLTIWSALAAESLAHVVCPKDEKIAYLAGMLKDLPLFIAVCKEDMPDFLANAPFITLSSPQQEMGEIALWGRTHVEIASDIVLYWGLPASLADAVRHHHSRDMNGLSPLLRVVALATRWAELVLAPHTDASILVGFELELAHMLNMTQDELHGLREQCASRFGALVRELGVDASGISPQYQEQHFSRIQSAYFLASEAVGTGVPEFSQLANTLQRHLKLFCQITTWQFYITKPQAEVGSFFSCHGGKLHSPVPLSQEQARAKFSKKIIELQYGEYNFGCFGFLGRQGSAEEDAQVALYIHVLTRKLGEQFMLASLHVNPAFCFTQSALPVAKYNRAKAKLDPSAGFNSLCGGVQDSGSLEYFLEDKLGLFSPSLQKTLEQKDLTLRQTLLLGRQAGIKREPLYFSLAQDPFDEDILYIYADMLKTVSPLLGVAIAYDGLLEALFQNLGSEVYLLDKTGNILWAAPSYADLIDKNLFAVTQSSTLPASSWNKQFLASSSAPQRISLFFSSEPTEAKTCICSVFTIEEQKYYVLGVVADASSQLMEAQKQAQMYDGLTGLYSFSHCCHLLQKGIERVLPTGRQMGLIYCDIANFSQFNSKYGHQAGDAVLRRVAGCVNHICRKGVDVACRLGNDDFVFLGFSTSHAGLEEAAQKLLQVITEKCQGAVQVHLGLGLVRTGESAYAHIETVKKASQAALNTRKPYVWI